jgi:hypothetical protein
MNTALRAVHRDELRDYLSHLGILQDVESERVHCGRCGAIMTLNTIGRISMQNGQLVITCMSEACALPEVPGSHRNDAE